MSRLALRCARFALPRSLQSHQLHASSRCGRGMHHARRFSLGQRGYAHESASQSQPVEPNESPEVRARNVEYLDDWHVSPSKDFASTPVLVTPDFTVNRIPADAAKSKTESMHVCMPDTIAIVVHSSDDNVLLVQKRYDAVNDLVLELPSTSLREDETPRKALARYLMDEFGLVARTVNPISWFYTDPKTSWHRVFLFNASNIVQSTDASQVETKYVNLRAISNQLARGAYQDSTTQAALASYVSSRAFQNVDEIVGTKRIRLFFTALFIGINVGAWPLLLTSWF